MNISMHEAPEYPIYSAGIDWVTTWNSDEFNVVMCASFMDGLFEELKERGHHIAKQVRLGYLGRATDGAFHGFYEGKSLAILSSDLAREFGVGLIKVSQRTSRIDLQVTVDTGAERPVLSLNAYHFATQSVKKAGRPREYKLTRTHPQGDTFNVNKRSSESYGRLYDWGAKNKMEEKHRWWRYEMEAKRGYCNHLASLISSHDNVEAHSTRIVYDWFKERTFSPPFKPSPLFCSQKPTQAPLRPGVLAWFEDTLSITIRKAIRDFGLQRTLEALKLHEEVNINTERR